MDYLNVYALSLTTPKEVQTFLKKFKNNKSPGTDGINYKVLKNLPNKGSIYITKLANAMMLLGYFPEQWKTAKIIVIPKPGKNLALPENYKPISLLPHLSKLTEKIVAQRIKNFVDSKNILIKEQFGFRQQHNTEMQVTRLVNKITQEYNNKKHTGGLFLDIYS